MENVFVIERNVNGTAAAFFQSGPKLGNNIATLDNNAEIWNVHKYFCKQWPNKGKAERFAENPAYRQQKNKPESVNFPLENEFSYPPERFVSDSNNKLQKPKNQKKGKEKTQKPQENAFG